MVFKEKFAPLILPNISLNVLNGKHPLISNQSCVFICLWAKTLQQAWPLQEDWMLSREGLPAALPGMGTT